MHTIVIPIYTTDLSADECRALAQCHRVLGRHRIVYVTPEGLDLTPLGTDLEQRTFAADYFASIAGYNRLMLSREFYAAFADSDYILIYQTDAWVFADRLDYWCSQGYDYIGAPWLGKPGQMAAAYRPVLWLRRLWARLTGRGLSALRKWKVGNGGLSLRRPRRFLEVLDTLGYDPATLLASGGAERNEDVIWSLVLGRQLRIPQWREALRFAVESRPAWALQLLGGEMPFGCHGWNKPPHNKFWKPFIAP